MKGKSEQYVPSLRKPFVRFGLAPGSRGPNQSELGTQSISVNPGINRCARQFEPLGSEPCLDAQIVLTRSPLCIGVGVHALRSYVNLFERRMLVLIDVTADP